MISKQCDLVCSLLYALIKQSPYYCMYPFSLLSPYFKPVWRNNPKQKRIYSLRFDLNPAWPQDFHKPIPSHKSDYRCKCIWSFYCFLHVLILAAGGLPESRRGIWWKDLLQFEANFYGAEKHLCEQIIIILRCMIMCQAVKKAGTLDHDYYMNKYKENFVILQAIGII